MAKYKKPAIVIGLLVVAGAIAAVAAPTLSQNEIATTEQKIFGISDHDLVFPYMRQPAWKQVAQGRYAVSPSRPENGFSDYAVSFDKTTNRICAVYATTKDLNNLQNLYNSQTMRFVVTALPDAHEIKWVFAEDCN